MRPPGRKPLSCFTTTRDTFSRETSLLHRHLQMTQEPERRALQQTHDTQEHFRRTSVRHRMLEGVDIAPDLVQIEYIARHDAGTHDLGWTRIGLLHQPMHEGAAYPVDQCIRQVRGENFAPERMALHRLAVTRLPGAREKDRQHGWAK